MAPPASPASVHKNRDKHMSAADDFRVADIALADWGRKEIAIAETEMPGLMALRQEFGERQVLAALALPAASI